MSADQDRARVAHELPPYGGHVRPDEVVRRSRLPAQRAWGALLAQCSDGSATASDGWITRGRDAGPARRRAA